MFLPLTRKVFVIMKVLCETFDPVLSRDTIAHVSPGTEISSPLSRAFGRRIEHQSLKLLVERFAAPEILFEFAPTPRNGYLREFSESFLGQKPDGPFKLSRTVFLERCPMLYHEIEMGHD